MVLFLVALTTAATIWLLFGLIAWGFYFAHLQGAYPLEAREAYWGDLWRAALWGLTFGPFAFYQVVDFGFDSHGLKWF